MRPVRFGFFKDQDATRHCYQRLRRLKQALRDDAIVRALADELGVSGGSRKELLAAVDRRIDELRASKDTLWYGVPAPEVLAASLFAARKHAVGAVDTLFSQVASADQLRGPLVTWLDLSGLIAQPGAERTPTGLNLVGYRGGAFISRVRLVEIEAASDAAAVEAALEQLRASRDRAHALYLACTPAAAAGYLHAHAAAPRVLRWKPEALRERLQQSGLGLLMIEGDAVAQVMLPVEHTPSQARLAELAAAEGPKKTIRW